MMRTFWLTALSLVGASLAFGQLETGMITIQASRSVNLAPDQVSFYLTLSAGPDVTLDQIVAALSGLGITASNLSGMYGGNDNRGSLQWSFTLAAPLAKMNATIASLIALQQSMIKNNSGMSLTFQMQGAYVSPQAFQSQSCSTNDLVSDAQTQAQNVATAAGFAVGPIIKISDGSSSTTPAFVQSDLFAVSFPSLLLGYTAPPSGCSLEVKFKLLRY